MRLSRFCLKNVNGLSKKQKLIIQEQKRIIKRQKRIIREQEEIIKKKDKENEKLLGEAIYYYNKWAGIIK